MGGVSMVPLNDLKMRPSRDFGGRYDGLQRLRHMHIISHRNDPKQLIDPLIARPHGGSQARL